MLTLTLVTIAEPGFPTPAKSSESRQPSARKPRTRLSDIHAKEQLEDSSNPVVSASSRRKRKKPDQQVRLDFSNHVGVKLNNTKNNILSDDSDSNTDDTMGRRGHHKLEAGLFGTQPKREEDSTDDSEDELTPKKSTPKKAINTSPSKKSSSLKHLRNGRRAMSLSRNMRSSGKKTVHVDLDDSDDDVVPGTTRHRSSNVDLTGAASETSGDDIPALHSTPAKKRRSNAKATPKELDNFVVSSDEEEGTESDVAPPPTAKSRDRSTKTVPNPFDEDESEDDMPVRAKKVQRPPRALTEREKEDLNEDLDFLRSSPPKSASRKKSNPRAEALEALKRKRAGLDAIPSSSQSRNGRSSGRAHPVIESDDEDDLEIIDEEDDDEAEVRGAEDRRRNILGAQNEEDEEFVVDDGEDAIGAPELDAEMPLWAGSFSRMKAKDLFEYAIRWMVQKKLNPTYAGTDNEEYVIAFRKLDDEVRGLAGSKFISSAWSREFTVSLQSRPGVEFQELSGMRSELDLDKCDACNRSGHPASWTIQFFGKPYDPKTLEDIEQYSDSDSDSEAESEEIDSKDRVVPPVSRIYNVGSTCKDNAMTAHALEHWRAHLYEWVVDYLKEEGHLTPAKIVKRDGAKEKKKRKYADEVVDEMTENGQIKKLYRDFREEIDTAREQTVSLLLYASRGFDILLI